MQVKLWAIHLFRYELEYLHLLWGMRQTVPLCASIDWKPWWVNNIWIAVLQKEGKRSGYVIQYTDGSYNKLANSWPTDVARELRESGKKKGGFPRNFVVFGIANLRFRGGGFDIRTIYPRSNQHFLISFTLSFFS